jgi:ABC-type transporter Mla maintaining outer membrane lipid asymmetry ATPase subunit MlaF
MAWAFEFVEVRCRLGDSWVLDRVSFGVRVGETVSLVGPAGSGKTVAFRLLAGLEQAQEGAVVVAGKDMARSRPRTRRALQRRLAVVFQSARSASYGLFDSADVLENVAFPMREVGRVPRRRLEAVALEELERFGLADRARARPADLDRDEAKRLAVARALAIRSPLVVIDALEDGLLPGSLALVTAALADLRADRGTSILMTSRDEQLAASVSDRVLALPDRAPVAHQRRHYDGSPSALIRR